MPSPIPKSAAIIAIVGMAREARIIAAPRIATIIGGGRAAALGRRLEAALAGLIATHAEADAGERAQGGDEAFRRRARPLLLSFGVCGALAPDLKAGDLVIGTELVTQAGRVATSPDWIERLSVAIPSSRQAVITAGDAMIGSVAAKRALYEATGAAVVDMESHLVAEAALRFGLDFAVVRAVSDAADHALPPAALAGLSASGQPNIAAVLGSLAIKPTQLPALLKTASGAGAGFVALERAAHALKWLV